MHFCQSFFFFICRFIGTLKYFKHLLFFLNWSLRKLHSKKFENKKKNVFNFKEVKIFEKFIYIFCFVYDIVFLMTLTLIWHECFSSSKISNASVVLYGNNNNYTMNRVCMWGGKIMEYYIFICYNNKVIGKRKTVMEFKKIKIESFPYTFLFWKIEFVCMYIYLYNICILYMHIIHRTIVVLIFYLILKVGNLVVCYWLSLEGMFLSDGMS